MCLVGMVFPHNKLNVKIRYTGMQDGNNIVKIETYNSRGKKVMDGSAEVFQPATIYVFTSQGSQEPGMGMDLYNNLLASCAF